MELKIDIDKKDNAVSLDRIIDMVLENAESDQQEQFDYMKHFDQKFMEEIKKYSHAIRNPKLDKTTPKQLEAVIENQSSDLHDVMSDAGIAYLKHGMKLGARVVFELLY